MPVTGTPGDLRYIGYGRWIMKRLDIQTRIQVKNVLFLTDFSMAAAEAIP
jgi:hypothetical protein